MGINIIFVEKAAGKEKKSVRINDENPDGEEEEDANM